VNINGWIVDADYLVGRRFEFVGHPIPDVTIVAFDVKRGANFPALVECGRLQATDAVDAVRVHDAKGGADWYPMDAFCQLIAGGVAVESETGVPFVNDHPMPAKVLPFYHEVKGWDSK
jgi:hypothetical protein